MRFVWLLLAFASLAHAQPNISARHVVRLDDYLSCNSTGDATAAIARALTAATGGTLFVPKNCQPVLASPGTSSPAISIPSRTTIQCEDGDTSGFKLARRYCTAGSYIGAGCAADADCGAGGTCGCDVGSGSSCAFAPTGSSNYAVIAAAASSKDVAIQNCRIDVRQVDGYGRCSGGSNAGLPCTTPAECSTGGGYCAVDTGKPSGAGDINVIDFSTARRGVIDGVKIYDHKIGDFAIKTGPMGRVVYSNTALLSATGTTFGGHCDGGADEGEVCDGSSLGGEPQLLDLDCASVVCTPPTRTVTYGIHLGGRSSIADANITNGATAAIYVGQDFYARVTRNYVTEGWSASTVGVYDDGTQSVISDNAFDAVDTCVRGGFNTQAVTAYAGNITFANNRCFGTYGPKVIAMGAGWKIHNNYLAWGKKQCNGGTRAGLLCSTDNTARGTGCPGATCTGCCNDVTDPAIQIGPGALTAGMAASHTDISGNIIHSDKAAPLIQVTNSSKRCTYYTGLTCSANTDCTCAASADCGTCDANADCGAGTCSCTTAGCGGTCTSGSMCSGGFCTSGSIACGVVANDGLEIAANRFYSNVPTSALDLSDIGAGSTSTMTGVHFASNYVNNPIYGIKFPSSTGGLTEFFASGNAFDTGTAPTLNWQWAFGSMMANAPYPAGTGEPFIAFLQANGTVAANDVVQPDTTTSTVKKATAGSVTAIGVALEASTAGNPVKVALLGPATCAAASATAISVGDPLKVDGANAGSVVTATTSENQIGFATAAKSGGSGSSVACYLLPRAGSVTAASYPPTYFMTGTPSNAATQYSGPGLSAFGGTEASNDAPVPGSSITRMTCAVSVAPGAAKSRTCTLHKNGATTGVTAWTCTISGAADLECCVTTAASGCDTNSASSATFTAGDKLTIETAPSGTPATADMSIALSGSVSTW